MFPKIVKAICVISLLSGLQNVRAQTAFHSMEEVWQYADRHNVTIRTAKADADKAGYAKKQSYGALLPQVAVNGSFTENTAIQTTLIPAVIFGGPEGQYRAVQFGQKYIYSGGITGQLDIVNLQSWFNVRIAEQTELYNQATFANTRKTVYQQIATQYYSYLLMKEAARLAKQSEQIADSSLQTVADKYKEGNVNEANVDIAKINAARARQTTITAQYQLRTARNNLKALLDLSATDSLAIESTLDNNMEVSVNAPMQEDPSIKQAYYQSQISLSQYKAGNSTFLPTVSVLYSNTTQQYDNKFEPFQGPAWFPAKYWTVKASWNIFTGGSRWYQAKKNKIAYEESVIQYEHASRQADINDENTKLAYTKAAELLKNAKEVMNLSLDNYRHMSNRYEAGIEPLSNRLSAFTDYISYQNQYLNSLSDMLVQLYQLRIRQQSF